MSWLLRTPVAIRLWDGDDKSFGILSACWRAICARDFELVPSDYSRVQRHLDRIYFLIPSSKIRQEKIFYAFVHLFCHFRAPFSSALAFLSIREFFVKCGNAEWNFEHEEFTRIKKKKNRFGKKN